MGAFKPLLPFGDRTVIEVCIEQLRSSGTEQIVVVLGHRGEEIRERLRDTDVLFAVNDDPDSAMADSIARGLEQLGEQTRCVLIMPVDHPATPGRIIEQVIAQWRAGHTLVQPEHNGRGGHPVLIDLVYRTELQNLDPHTGLRGFFERHRADVRRVPVNSPFIARDLDTWEDYLALHQEVFGRPPRPI